MSAHTTYLNVALGSPVQVRSIVHTTIRRSQSLPVLVYLAVITSPMIPRELQDIVYSNLHQAGCNGPLGTVFSHSVITLADPVCESRARWPWDCPYRRPRSRRVKVIPRVWYRCTVELQQPLNNCYLLVSDLLSVPRFPPTAQTLFSVFSCRKHRQYVDGELTAMLRGVYT